MAGAILQVGCLSEIQEYIPVDGNFEDGTTAILREIGQDSDCPDSDSGSEMELESQHVGASLVPLRAGQRAILKFYSNLTNFYQ